MARARRRGRFALRALFRRRLFWRFYLTLLASLMIMVVLGGFIWRTVADAPEPDLQAAVAHIAAALDARVTLIDRLGRAVAAAGRSDDPHDAFRDPNDTHLPRGRSFRAWRVDLPDGRMLIARGLHNFTEGPPPGFYYLFLVAIGIGIAAFPFVRRITLRLERLRGAVESWGQGHLDTRVPDHGQDEIAAVARSFNGAASRVEALIAAHRTLLANASHELRSPLARLRMAVEVYRTEPTPALEHAITQDIGELDQLVEEILLASRLDHVGPAFEREIIDLLGLAAEEAARVDAILIGPATGSQGGDALLIKGSPRLLRRLIRNLLENARRHGRPPIEISLRRGSDTVVLEVADHGNGIPEAERTRVFEPFYRPVGHAETGGSWGLGLALVARIAENHGGKVTCRESPGGGALFEAVLRGDVVGDRAGGYTAFDSQKDT